MTSPKAVFLDRDGTLNENVFYHDTQAWESPRSPQKLVLTPGVAAALRSLRSAGYLLFLVSNQPNAAKGKASKEDLRLIHEEFLRQLHAESCWLDEAHYCFHHPSVDGPCPCRKPEPYFLLQASRQHGIELAKSWIIGDRLTDIECGLAAGTRTAWIDTRQEVLIPQKHHTHLRGSSLLDLVGQILSLERGPQ